MLRGDEDWMSLTDAFYAAAIDGTGWDVAIGGLAAATGSRGGQLVGFGSENAAPFNWVTGVGKEWCEDFLAHGGADPSINPNVRAGASAAPLTVLASADFVSREQRRASAFLQDFTAAYDTPYICLTPLIKDQANHIGIAVLRSRKQGEITAQERAVFASVAPHVQAAVKMQMTLEHQGAKVVAGAMDALSRAVFVCDRHGIVRAMTAAAEAMVTAGDALRLGEGLLSTANPLETRALSDAIVLAACGFHRPGAPLLGSVVVRFKDRVLALDVLPLPRREYSLGFEPRALVVVRGSGHDSARIKALLQAAYGLTSAEVDVALRISEGLLPEAIAAARGAAIGTVRSQLRTVYAKLGVGRQTELVALLRQFC